jgi:hypothetical protein
MKKYLLALSLGFLCLIQNFSQAQFIFADPPFRVNTSANVIYQGPLSLPTNRNASVFRRVKVSLQSDSGQKISVYGRENYFRTVYLDSIRYSDSTFGYLSEGIGKFIQFVFAPPSSIDSLGYYGIYGFSPTISVNYGVMTSVIVGADRPFAIYPNPVNQMIVDVQIPGTFPYASPYTRFRIINMSSGLLELDIALIELEQNAATNTFNSLRNGNYIAQIINSLVGVSNTFSFTISR